MNANQETIPSGIKDPNYRYRMVKMNLKNESRLNGAKTNIFNVYDVADDLRVPSESIMKYMSSELGANLEESTKIKGVHKYEDLLKLLDKFIMKYVCCQNCKYPELIYSLEGKKGKEGIKSICKSCGSSNTHDASSKAGKVIVKWLKENQNKPDTEMTQQDMQKNAIQSDFQNTTKEIETSNQLEEMSDNDAELKPESRRIARVITLVQKLMKDEPDISNDEIETYLMEQRATFNITGEFLHLTALCGVFGTRRNIVKYWDVNEQLFLRLVKFDGHKGLDHFMSSLVWYFQKFNKDHIKFAETFLKKLLDENVISDTYLLGWCDRSVDIDKDSELYSKRKQRIFIEHIEPFITWLKEAETEEGTEGAAKASKQEESEEEEDDEDGQIKDKGNSGDDKQRRMLEQIEKERIRQQKELDRLKQKADEEHQNKIDVTAVNADDQDVDIDDI